MVFLHIFRLTSEGVQKKKFILYQSYFMEMLFQVAVSCDHVFLDGSETRGAKNVTVLVRTGERMAQLGVRVWVPEPRLDIQLSDSKLSQVRGWRVERPQSTM